MNIWAIADLHLCFGVPEKTMEIFGDDWKNYVERIKTNWKASVKDDDLVLLPGDISWAKNLDEAMPDFLWIDKLPGTKVIIKGNHDYWWSTQAKLKDLNLPSIHFIHNNTFNYRDISIAGARLWDSDEYEFSKYIRHVKNPKESKEKKIIDNKKIFSRELQRLELSLKEIDKKAKLKIVMTHYPPVSANLERSKVTALLEKYNIDICVFGHLHHVDREKPMFGTKDNIKYMLVSADFLEFKPLKIY